MVASTLLSVPKPALQYDGAPGPASLEKPVNVNGEAVKLNGNAVGPESLSLFGLLIYRRLTSGASQELWNDGDKTWVADPGDALTSLKLPKLISQPSPAWQAIVVGAGTQDAAGKPQFAKAIAGYPLYTFRTVFSTQAGPLSRSEETDPISFISSSDKNLMILGPGDDEKPENATLARIGLKNPALSQIGIVLIERDGSGAKITLGNASGATVVIGSDGSIVLNPASGQTVTVNGDIEVGRLTYQPGGGGAKQTL